MAINFPSSPTLNETFTHTDGSNTVVYKWDGTSWIAISGLGSETSISTLADLTDVSDLAKTNLDILTWFSANSTWAPGESGASSFDGQFSSLTGVPTTLAGYGITDAFSGDYNNLVNRPSLVTSLNNLSDVNTLSITPQTADVLSWTANNTWEPQQVSGGGGGSTAMNTAIAETGVEVEIIVMVITKTSMHRYNGQGSSLGYTFRVNGVDYESPFLDLVPGKTYKFEQGDPSNASHSIRFYEDAVKTTPYTTNVTVSGSAGTSGAYTSIAVTESTPSILHYQCVNHTYMGNQVQVKGIGISGGSYTNTNVDTHLNQSSATSGQVLSWNGTDYAWSNPAGSSTQAREIRSLISSSPIPDGGSFDMDFTTINTTPNAIFVPHSYLLQKITTDYSAWVVLYSSSTARTNDSSRLINQDPEPGSGVILEVVTTDTSLQQLITPGVMGFIDNITGPDAGTIFFKIVNLSGAQQQITLTLDYLPLEWS